VAPHRFHGVDVVANRCPKDLLLSARQRVHHLCW
jgi:hypothetical protein